MYEEHERSSNHASIGAQNNSVAAGRDVHDHRDQRSFLAQVFFGADQSPPPRPDSPHLEECPHCGRPWVSRFALFCLTCGYSVQMARQLKKQRENVTYICAVLAVVFGLCVMAVGLAVYMGDRLTADQQITTLYLTGLTIVAAGLAFASYRGRRFDP